MTLTATLETLRRFGSRQWPIILAAALAAALVGYVAAGDISDRHVALAPIDVDTSALARFTGLVGTERLLASTLGEDFAEEAAALANVPVDELEAGLHLYTAGNPVRFFVEYSHADADEAVRVADVVATFVVEWQERLSDLDLTKQRIIVDESKRTLANLEQAIMESEWERADLEYKVWTIRRELATNEAILIAMERIYVYSGDPEITLLSGATERSMTALGAALVGLFFGILIGAARHYREMRVA
ncbi:MAG: hypothetical protein U1E29_04470 [Coriobacteriia bacterium]|nr:hypothetical protein [Coriobacteriia bacterium]